MPVDVFDAWASHAGQPVHFDVLVPRGTAAEQAQTYALEWLRASGLPSADVQLARCSFCHVEQATAEVQTRINRHGYAVVPLQGCPAQHEGVSS